MGQKSLEERVATTEANVRALATEVGQIHDVVNSLTNTVQKGFEDLRSKQTENIKTDWNVIWAAAAVVLTICTLVGTVSIREEERQNVLIAKNSQMLYEHQLLGGHAKMEERVSHIERAQLKLDEVLQREMRILDSAMAGDIEAQDTRLQREMELIRQQLHTEIKGILHEKPSI